MTDPKKSFDFNKLIQTDEPVLEKEFDFNKLIKTPSAYQKTSPKSYGDSFGANLLEGGIQGTKGFIGSAAYTVGEAAKLVDEDWSKRIQDWSKNYSSDVPEPDGSFGQWIGGIVPSVVPTAAAIGAGIVSAPAAAIAAPIALGTLAASAIGSGMKEYEEYKTEKGEDVDQLAKLGVGLAYGTAEFIFERAGLNRLMPKGTAAKLIGNPAKAEEAGKEIMSLWMKSNPSKTSQLLKNIGKAGIVEGSQEALTEAAQSLTELFYKSPEDRPEFTDVVLRAGEAFAAGAIMGVGLGPLSYGAQQAQNKRRRQEQGRVLMAEHNGNAVELIQRKKDVDQGYVYSVMAADNSMYDVPESEIKNQYTLSYDQFQNIIRGKAEETKTIREAKIEEAVLSQNQVFESVTQNFAPYKYQGADGAEYIGTAIYNGQKVIVGRSGNKAAITPEDAPGTTPVPVQFSEIEDTFQEVPFESFVLGFTGRPIDAEKAKSRIPHKGQTFEVGGITYKVTGYNPEQHLATFMVTSPGIEGFDVTQMQGEELDRLYDDVEAQVNPVQEAAQDVITEAEDPFDEEGRIIPTGAKKSKLKLDVRGTEYGYTVREDGGYELDFETSDKAQATKLSNQLKSEYEDDNLKVEVYNAKESAPGQLAKNKFKVRIVPRKPQTPEVQSVSGVDDQSKPGTKVPDQETNLGQNQEQVSEITEDIPETIALNQYNIGTSDAIDIVNKMSEEEISEVSGLIPGETTNAKKKIIDSWKDKTIPQAAVDAVKSKRDAIAAVERENAERVEKARREMKEAQTKRAPLSEPAQEAVKKGKKLKSQSAKLKEVEPMTARQWVLQYFIKGGRINSAEFTRETGKGRVSKRDGRKIGSKENQSAFTLKKDNGPTIETLTGRLMEEMPQINESDARAAIIDVINDYSDKTSMEQELMDDFSIDGEVIVDMNERIEKMYQKEQERYLESMSEEELSDLDEFMSATYALTDAEAQALLDDEKAYTEFLKNTNYEPTTEISGEDTIGSEVEAELETATESRADNRRSPGVEDQETSTRAEQTQEAKPDTQSDVQEDNAGRADRGSRLSERTGADDVDGKILSLSDKELSEIINSDPDDLSEPDFEIQRRFSQLAKMPSKDVLPMLDEYFAETPKKDRVENGELILYVKKKLSKNTNKPLFQKSPANQTSIFGESTPQEKTKKDLLKEKISAMGQRLKYLQSLPPAAQSNLVKTEIAALRKEIQRVNDQIDGALTREQATAGGEQQSLFQRVFDFLPDLSNLDNTNTASFVANGPFAPQSKERVEEVAKKLMKKWKNAPDLVVYESSMDFLMNHPEIQVNDPRQISGVFYKGKVHIVAGHSKFRNSNTLTAEVLNTLAHEVFGHYGLRGMVMQTTGQDQKAFRQELNRLMDDILLTYAGTPRIERLSRTYFGKPFSQLTKSQQREVGEEIIAHMAELNQDASLMDRLVTFVRKVWRNITGDYLKMTDAEVRSLIRNSRKFVEVGENNFVTRMSKMQESGRPDAEELRRQVEAYHGSPYSFDRFTTDKIGTGEGAQAFGWGLYFTDLESIAKAYGNRLQKVKSTYNGQNIPSYYTEETLPKKIAKLASDVLKEMPGVYKKPSLPFINSAVSLAQTKQQGVASVLGLNFSTDDINLEERISDSIKNYEKYGYHTADGMEAMLAKKLIDTGFKTETEKYLYKTSLHKGKTPNQYTWLEWDKPVTDNQFKSIRNQAVKEGNKSLVEAIDKELSLKRDYLQELGAIEEKIDAIAQKYGYEYHLKSNLSKYSKADQNSIQELYAEYQKLDKEYRSPHQVPDKSLKGEILYENWLSGLYLDSPKEASLFLLRAGIDGIRYPAESVARGATSDNARGFNYVVFDENAVTIEEQVRFQLIGENANLKQTVRDNLGVAREMESTNKDTKTIRLATGWERGADGKWRYEIDDNLQGVADVFELEGKARGDVNQKLGVFLSKELGDLYPQIKDIQTRIFIDPSQNNTGNYRTVSVEVNDKKKEDYKEITVRAKDAAQAQSILLHEIQHAIQDIEGFAKGGNVNDMALRKKLSTAGVNNVDQLNDKIKLLKKEYQLLYNEWERKAFGKRYKGQTKETSDLLRKWKNIEDGIKELESGTYNYQEAFEVYKKLAGEVEARNVESRMNMTPEQRRSTTLQETEDVAREEQILLFGNDSPRFQLAPPTDSKAFKDWFGDSKVVNQDGSPMVVYHGTQSDFDSFDKKKAGSAIDFGTLGEGFYFTTDPENASNYARNLSSNTGISGGENIIPAYLSIKNPYKTTNLREVSGDNKSESRKFREKLIAKGYDGIEFYYSYGPFSWYVAFEPTQIKSATGNIGTYDPNNPDIRFQRAPQEGTDAFNKFKGKAREVYGAAIQEVKSGEPVLIRAYHGTTNDFYVFDSKVKGNIHGHLGRINYFTSDLQDASQNYLSSGSDLTNRIEFESERLESELEYEYDDFFEAKNEIAEKYGYTKNQLTALGSFSELAKDIARKKLQGRSERVLDLYIKLNKPLVLGNKSTWIETLNVSEDDLNDAAQEIADEYGIDIEEAKQEYEYEIRETAIQNTGYENIHVEALSEALSDNGYDPSKAAEILGENYYETEIDLNKLEKDLRKAELYENEEGEMASSQVIADFFKKLGYDGIILTDVADRFKNMGLSSDTSHIHVFDEYNNQIKLASGENTTFNEATSDIRFQRETSDEPIEQIALRSRNLEDFIDAMQDFRDAHGAPSKETSSIEERKEFGGDFSLREVSIDDVWWDGNDINEWGYDTGNSKRYSRRELKEIYEKAIKDQNEDLRFQRTNIPQESFNKAKRTIDENKVQEPTGQLNIFGDQTPFQSISDKDGKGYGNKPSVSNIQRPADKRRAALSGQPLIGPGQVAQSRYVTFDKNWNFTGKEVIKSAEDVAYIFKQLENETVEHAFAVHIHSKGKNKGKYYVQHIGTGTIGMTVMDDSSILAAANSLGTDQVVFVHNHPSGTLKASDPDIKMLRQFKKTFEPVGIQVLPGVIINLTSGEYLQFNEFEDFDSSNRSVKKTGPGVDIQVLNFNKRVFYDGFQKSTIGSSSEIAKYISAYRHGVDTKFGYLLLSNQYEVIGNFPSELKTAKEVIKDAKINASKTGARRIALYGNAKVSKEEFDFIKLEILADQLIDYIQIESSSKTHKSVQDGNVGFVEEPKFQIVGENASLSENASTNLLVAKQMEDGKTDPKTIRLATGWEKGKDGKWKYEIPDATLKLPFESLTKNTYTLGELLDGELFKAYSELSKTKVQIEDDTKGMNAWFDDKIHIKRPNKQQYDAVQQGLPKESGTGRKSPVNRPFNFRSSLLHEVQHIIQKNEGFDPGTNPQAIWQGLIQNKVEEFKQKDWYQHLPIETQTTIAEGEISDEFLNSGYAYLRKTGEVEARNVEARMGMTPDQRRNTLLSETEDVSRDNQILEPRFQKSNDNFYSNSLRVVANISQPKATGEQWKKMLINNGASEAELKWIGFDDFLKNNPKPTKEQVYDFIEANKVDIVEVLKEGEDIGKNVPEEWERANLEGNLNAVPEEYQELIDLYDGNIDEIVDAYTSGNLSSYWTERISDENYESWNYMTPSDQESYGVSQNPTKYSQYTLPGGENYREVLLTMANKDLSTINPRLNELQRKEDNGTLTIAENKEYEDLVEKYRKAGGPSQYKSSHWDEPNILTHIRLNDRVVNGEKVLFVEEIQSDFSQDVRSGKTEAKTPFPQTSQWVNLSLRRIIRMASEEGYDRVAFINGEQSAERYDLSKEVSKIETEKVEEADGLYFVDITLKKGNPINLEVENGVIREGEYKGKGLDEVIGKELAQNILQSDSQTIEGENLKIGGKGMIDFYNKIIPAQAKKVLAKIDKTARLEEFSIETQKQFTTEDTYIATEGNKEMLFPKVGSTEKPLATMSKETAKNFSVKDLHYELVLLANKYAKVPESSKQLSFPITPILKQTAIQEGMPMFQRVDVIEESPAIATQKFDRQREALQDSYIYVKRLIDTKNAAALDDVNAYRFENLSKGIINEKLKAFRDKFITPLSKQMLAINREFGANYDETNRYLKAKHIVLDNIEAGGIPINEAKEIVRAYKLKVSPEAVTRLENMVRDINRFVLETRVETGLISKESMDKLMNEYKFYIPLRGFAEAMDQDTTVFTKEVARKGRTTESGDPLPYLHAMAQTAIVKGQQNLVKQRLFEFVKQFPDSRIYSIKSVWYVNYGDGEWQVSTTRPPQEVFEKYEVKRNVPIDEMTEQEMANFRAKNTFGEQTVSVMVDGKKFVMEFFGEGAPIARAIRNMDVDKSNAVIKVLGSYTRTLTKFYTQYSPEFAFRNLVRDMTTGLINVRNDHGNAMMGKVIKGIPSAMKTIASMEWRNKEVSKLDERIYKAYKDNGSMTGYSDLRDVKTFAAEFENNIKALQGNKIKWTMEQLTKLFRPLDQLNRVFENTVRFAAFRELVKAEAAKRGITVEQMLDSKKGFEQPAAYAKDLTVNFNRRGNWSSTVGSIYLFFNASVQGNERLLRPFGFFNPNPTAEEKQIRMRAYRSLFALGAIGAAMSLINRSLGGEDEDGEYFFDKLSTFTRTHNLIIPKWWGEEGEFIQIPLPYGYNSFFVGPELIIRALLGKDTALQSGMNILDITTESFSPLGAPMGEADPVDALLEYTAPTVAKPLIQWSMNKNFAGMPIYKEGFPGQTPRPDSEMHFKSVNPLFAAMTKELNALTGGDEERSGYVDINPELIEHVIGSYGGGVYTFGVNTSTTFMHMMAGENPMADQELKRKVPFVRNYQTKPSPQYNRSRFYDQIREVKAAEDIYKRYLKSGQTTKARDYMKENKELLKTAAIADKYADRVKDLTDRRKALEKAGKNPEDIDNLLNDIYMKMNRAYNREEKVNWLQELMK